ncbi:MAG TPA: ATP-binding SpoIIE family protein phosphatase [Bryobacteraceae bacterium]|jgi:anti-sigma regulatory factor (Ser/Thr protein kinase)|nr:ATP-binding SpoIIE family protein phosphatase [Bryobacteraceae bacterium]
MSTISIPVEGPDQVGEARREGASLAIALGFDEEHTGRVAIVVTECASNLWKHGGGGEVLISTAENDGRPCIEVIALDRGPGMADVSRCFEDGYSTAGSAGSGLGALARLSECTVYSRPGKGTALLSRLFIQGSRKTETSALLTGGIAVPLAGEPICGDAFAVRHDAAGMLAILADGLGHGPSAAESANRALEAFRDSRESAPGKILPDIHTALRGGRGGAVSVARLNLATRKIQFCGVGNVLGMLSGFGAAKNFVCMPGIVGHNMNAVREFTYDWPANSVVLIYSDGIGSHWSLDEYEGLVNQDPSLISAVIYRDRKRGRDDASVLAIRERRSA